jgi:diguanylate cyclase (GGDEF)-like protein
MPLPAGGLRALVTRPLALVVLAAAVLAAAAGLALTKLVADSERDRADARLAAELSGAVRTIDALRRSARATAVRLARTPAVQRALAERDRERLARFATRGVTFEAGGRTLAGTRRPAVVSSRAAVVLRGREVGVVVVGVPIDEVERRTALGEGGRLLVLDGAARLPASRSVTVGGQEYRALETRGGAARLAAMTPFAPIEESIDERQRRVVYAVLASFVAFVLLAALAAQLARPVARPLRRAADAPPGRRGRRRSRQAATLVGNALAAGNDFDALLPVILDSAVAVTGASGARLVADGEEIARSGVVRVGRPPLVFALSAGAGQETQLVLEPPAVGDFDDEAVRLAEWLAGRASIALQNAHLHGVAQHLASTDELTQLANRRHFDEALRAEVERAERFGDPVAVVVADLDNFKEVNDRHGHDVGDVVLQAFAEVIRANVRDIDVPARYGGEEFTVLLPATDAEGGRELAERLRTALQELSIGTGDGGLVRITCSFGVAGFPEEPSAPALLRAGDRALYRAKAAGKNAVVVARPAREAT